MTQHCRKCSRTFRAKDAAKVLTPPSCWNYCSVACIEAWHVSQSDVYAACMECGNVIRSVPAEYLVGGAYGREPFCDEVCREVYEVHEACKVFSFPSFQK